MKFRRICLGTAAAKQACFSVYVENSFASGKTKRPRGPRSSLTMLRPYFDLQTRALAYYLQYHLQTLTDVPNISGGLSECVSAWKLSGRTYPVVDLALSSMALAVYSRTQQHPPAATEASLRYYRLLQIAQEQIAQTQILAVSEPSIDACLLAAFLMGRYEGVTHHPGHLDSKGSLLSLPSWSHYDGVMAILKVWNDHLSHNAAAIIIKHTRRQLIKFSLLRNLLLPEWILDGNRFGEHELEHDYDRIVVQMVNLCYKLRNLQQKNDLQPAKAEELNNEARELDKALQGWIAQIPTIHSYHRHILTQSDPWPKAHFYSSVVYSYSNPGYAAVWVEYFAARMLINNTRLRVLELSHSPPLVDFTANEQRLECITTLKAMANSLASSIPFCLERVKASFPDSPSREVPVTFNAIEEIKPYLANWIVWPLTVASSLERIDIK
jgi:hypothetical protein